MGTLPDLRIYVAVTSPYPWNRGVTIAMDMMDKLLDALLSRNFGGSTTILGWLKITGRSWKNGRISGYQGRNQGGLDVESRRSR